MDGKTVRGARRADGTQVHLLAAMTCTGLVATQREVGFKTNEITVFKPMLAGLDLTDTVVTFDALHSQTGHARFLVEEKKAHYIAVIKGNQPLLHQRLKRLPWRDVPLLDKTRATAHGRDEIRQVKTCTVTRGLGFPHAAQAVQIVRRRRMVTTGKVTLERVYAVTDLTAEQADVPEIAHRVREHWGIENKIHHVRDTTFAKDAPPAFGREVPPHACGPGPHPAPWPPCATWPSAPSASPAATTSPPACASMAEMPPDHWPPSASRDQTGRIARTMPPCHRHEKDRDRSHESFEGWNLTVRHRAPCSERNESEGSGRVSVTALTGWCSGSGSADGGLGQAEVVSLSPGQGVSGAEHAGGVETALDVE
ncbi:ISAs1 family transposase [Streptomyces sp. NPDC094049]|uniref:ISAs1 family transposase n=1 Tax=Streptomyces sp. NPDC094049 TaxID=3154987 RepID=UPI0033277B36